MFHNFPPNFSFFSLVINTSFPNHLAHTQRFFLVLQKLRVELAPSCVSSHLPVSLYSNASSILSLRFLISLCTDPSPLVSHKLFENWEHLWISVSKGRNAAQLLIEYIHGRKRHFIRIQIVPLKDLRVMISLAVASFHPL